jgi:hypothetical protein
LLYVYFYKYIYYTLFYPFTSLLECVYYATSIF